MQPISLSDLSHLDFDIRGIVSRREDFRLYDENDYLASGRERHLLHIVTSGSRRYRTETEQFSIKAGTILFIPAGTRYFTRACGNSDCVCSGIGICFDLQNAHGEDILLEPGVYHEWNDEHDQFFKLFLDISRCCQESPYSILRIKSLMFTLLSRLLYQKGTSQLTRSIIAPALTFLANRYQENLPVKVYADACSMSESYFRKKFLEYTGMSPIEYRNRLRFAEAKRLYAEGKSMQEIAAQLGFSDAGYLTKLYKRSLGVSLRADSGGDIV